MSESTPAREVSRRRFLQGTALAGFGAFLAACSGSSSSTSPSAAASVAVPTPPPTSAPAPPVPPTWLV